MSVMQTMEFDNYQQLCFANVFAEQWERALGRVAAHPTDAIGFAASDEFAAWSGGFVDAVIAVGDYDFAADLAWLRSVWFDRVYVERRDAIAGAA